MYKIMAKEAGHKRFSAISISDDGISTTKSVLFTSFFDSRIDANQEMRIIAELAKNHGVKLELKVVQQ